MTKQNQIKIPTWEKRLHQVLIKLESRLSKWSKRIVIDS